MRPFLSLIEAKRDGLAIPPDELAEAVQSFTAGAVPDYQMAAFLMAVLFQGMNEAETRALTLAMRDSGRCLQFPEDPRPVVDKHSTGGVGDKVSLPLVPLLMSLGFRVPMISGRGLGLTGGTLDKLESIPGFRTDLAPEALMRQVQELGGAMGGQTEIMVPADRALYALRDVTGTVPSIPLITASILSKKLAEGLHGLVLDVKVGEAAFMRHPDEARHLARSMVGLAAAAGLPAVALLSRMDQPLGRAVGNWLEVREAVACLEGRGPADLRELIAECAALLLELTGKAMSLEEGRRQALAMLDSGVPRQAWRRLLQAQGARLEAYEEKLARTSSPCRVWECRADRDGFVRRCSARRLGELVRDLGGGRRSKGDALDPEVGVDQILTCGEAVRRGDPLCRVHLPSTATIAEWEARVQAAFEIGSDPAPEPSSPILEIIRPLDPPKGTADGTAPPWRA